MGRSRPSLVDEGRRAAPHGGDAAGARSPAGGCSPRSCSSSRPPPFCTSSCPKLLGLRDTWNRIQHGNAWWLALAAVLEVCSFLGYIALFRVVFVRGDSRIDWRASYEITMAGLAATRLFASAGAGGIALTAWALRRSGMEPRIVACRMIAFMALALRRSTWARS